MDDDRRIQTGDETGLGGSEADVAVAPDTGTGKGRVSQQEVLREARREFGWTQADAARAAGVSPRTWQMWEAEEGTTSYREAPEMLFRLLELNRRLNGAGLPVSWDEINQRAADRSGAMMLRPPRVEYGRKDQS